MATIKVNKIDYKHIFSKLINEELNNSLTTLSNNIADTTFTFESLQWYLRESAANASSPDFLSSDIFAARAEKILASHFKLISLQLQAALDNTQTLHEEK